MPIWRTILLLYNAALAHPVFPSVENLEQAFHLVRGAQLPKDVQAEDGKIYHTYYVAGRSLGNGEYSVIVKLHPAKGDSTGGVKKIAPSPP